MEPARAAPPPAGARFVDIQWLRGLAAALVLFEHLKNEMAIRLLGVEPQASPFALFPFPAGVDIFFVISGFVIAHASMGLHGRGGAWRQFLLRRLARIVPLYWAVTALFLLLLVAAGSRLAAELTPAFLLGSFLFVPVANLDGVPLPLMPLGWTLNYEMFFYLVFAAAIALPRGRALLATVGSLVALVLLGRLVAMPNLALAVWSDPIVLEFGFGIAIQVAVARGFRLPAAARLALALAALAALAAVGMPGDITQRWYLWGVPAAMLVLAATTGGEGARPDARWAEWAGDTSYALYLGHLLVLIAMARLFQFVGLTGDLLACLLYAVTTVPLAVLFSLALHLLFEKPSLRFLRARLDRKVTAGPGGEPGP